MGWKIGVRENTLRMSDEVFNALATAAENEGNYIGMYNGLIEFDDNAMEWMDFLYNDWAIEILNDPSVNGDVVFASTEGDNSGDIWGYRFKNGKMSTLVAEVTMKEIA